MDSDALGGWLARRRFLSLAFSARTRTGAPKMRLPAPALETALLARILGRVELHVVEKGHVPLGVALSARTRAQWMRHATRLVLAVPTHHLEVKDTRVAVALVSAYLLFSGACQAPKVETRV